MQSHHAECIGAAVALGSLSTGAECCASVGWNYAQQFAAAIETDKAANTATALFTSHGYFVAPDSPLRGWSKPVWETEWAPFGLLPWAPAWDDGSASSGGPGSGQQVAPPGHEVEELGGG